ncbi:hypothetical protein BR93DRAFT_876274 [Coniochaeta sp. PMI_546]|nr:hypothetical protein BR93DRAFT_876274 [Coniochaeta sp. PMI_546]
MRQWTESCINNNPAYRLEYMTDHSADDYVKQTFAAHPDIVNTYLSLSVPILKADLLRYLILFAEGGVYSDLDVSCEGTPIEQWVPSEYENDAALVVGWEFDAGWGQNFVRQFATWIIMAKPGLPHMWMVIEDVIQGLHDMAVHNNVTLSGLKHSMVGDVCDVTGPRRFTRSILKSLSSSVEGQIYEQSLSNLRKPRLVGDVLILPGYAFAASTNHYHEKETLGPVLVTHHYASTWRNELGGELVNQLV